MSTIESALTAEAYRLLPDMGQPTELVKGRLQMMNMPGFRHGKVCGTISRSLGNFVDQRGLGHVVSNDSGIITQHSPDTVRGADVAFYSFTRLPKATIPQGYPDVAPEVVVEVLSPHDRWGEVYEKVAEYLRAGVLLVLVADPEQQDIRLFENERPMRVFTTKEELCLPGILADFRVRVGSLFE